MDHKSRNTRCIISRKIGSFMSPATWWGCSWDIRTFSIFIRHPVHRAPRHVVNIRHGCMIYFTTRLKGFRDHANKWHVCCRILIFLLKTLTYTYQSIRVTRLFFNNLCFLVALCYNENIVKYEKLKIGIEAKGITIRGEPGHDITAIIAFGSR